MENKPEATKKTIGARILHWGLSIIAIVLLILAVGYFTSDFILSWIITSRLSDYCGTETKIDNLYASPEDGRVEITKIEVANPAGFSEHPLFSAQSMVIDVAPSSLWKQERVIEELCIDGFTLFYERLAGGKNNLSTLIDNFVKKSDGKAETVEDGSRYRIDKLRLTGIKVVLLINDRLHVVKIDDIILSGIGRDRALTKDEVVEYIVTHFSGVFDAENFAIANPDGFTEKDFIRIGKFHVELDMSGVPQRHYRIKTISANEFSLNMESLANGRNNMNELAMQLQKDQQMALAHPSSATVVIDDFLIGDVNLILSNNGMSKRVSLGKMELKAIGSQKPMAAGEAALYILTQLSDFVNRSGSKVAQTLNELMKESAQPALKK